MDDGTKKRLRNLVARMMQVEVIMIDDRASSMTIDSWDSLNHMKLIFALEEEFKVLFSEEQIVAMTSYPKIVSILEELLSIK